MDAYEQPYFYENSEEHKKSSAWLWIIVIIVIIIILVGIGLLIWWFATRESQKELTISGTNFTTPSSSSISATWTSVGNSDDNVTLYIQLAGTPINFNSSGQPTNTSAVVTSAGPVNGNTTKTLTASNNISAGKTYNGVLVVTNPNALGYSQVTSKSLIPGSTTPGTGVFHIQAASQSGEIVYSHPGLSGVAPDANPTVGYNFSGQTSSDNNLFHNDSDGLLCTAMLSQSGFINLNPTTTKCGDLGDDTFILYDTTTTGTQSGTTALGIKRYEDSDATNNNAKWTYSSTSNKWCLTNNTAKCFALTDFVNLVSQEAAIDITSSAANATTWNNLNFSITSS